MHASGLMPVRLSVHHPRCTTVAPLRLSIPLLFLLAPRAHPIRWVFGGLAGSLSPLLPIFFYVAIFWGFLFFLFFFCQNGGGGKYFCKLSVYFLFFLFVPKVIKLFGGVGQNGIKQ